MISLCRIKPLFQDVNRLIAISPESCLGVKADFVSFRVCMDPNDEMKAGLLAQAESGEGVLTAGRWQHLAFTYTQQPEGKKNIRGQLTMWVCGIRWEHNHSLQDCVFDSETAVNM